MTPLLEGYARDNVRMRVIQGSQEEQHLFQVHGLRWREEPDDPGSPLVSAQTIGISEAFNVEMPGFDCSATDTPCRGDYLYGGTSMDNLWNGMWGLMRVHGRPSAGPALAPRQPGHRDAPDAPRSAVPPGPTARHRDRATPARPERPERKYDVVAITKDVVYNEFGDHDPLGLMYVLAEDEAAVRSGARKPEPLVLRANAGDCVKVTLRNGLPAAYGNNVNGVDGDPAMVLEPAAGTKMGTRVSLHPQLLRHDVRLSDGAAVGFNPDSTAALGQTVSYEWYADTELGATNLLDYGDVRGHRQHGLAAALVVEPKDSTYHDPATGAQVRSGVTADIRTPGQEDFRETALVYQDGLNLRTSPEPRSPTRWPRRWGRRRGGPRAGGRRGARRAEVGGRRRRGRVRGRRGEGRELHQRPAAPAARRRRRELLRFGATSAEWASVFSSATHGDPWTPTAARMPGTSCRMRVLGGNRPRQMGFQLDGASWRAGAVRHRVAPGRRAGRHRHRQGRQRPRAARRGRGPPVELADHRRPAAGHLGHGAGLPLAGGRRRLRAHRPGPRRTTPSRPARHPSSRSSGRPLAVRTFTDTDGDGTRDAGETAATGDGGAAAQHVGRASWPRRRPPRTGRRCSRRRRGSYDVEVVPPSGHRGRRRRAPAGGPQRRRRPRRPLRGLAAARRRCAPPSSRTPTPTASGMPASRASRAGASRSPAPPPSAR